MAQTAEEVFARDAAKMAARNTFGAVRKVTPREEFINTLAKSMILDLLADEDVYMNVFTDAERDTLEGAIIIRS